MQLQLCKIGLGQGLRILDFGPPWPPARSLRLGERDLFMLHCCLGNISPKNSPCNYSYARQVWARDCGFWPALARLNRIEAEDPEFSHRRVLCCCSDESGLGQGLKKENNLNALNTFGKTGKSIFRGFRSGTIYLNRIRLNIDKGLP